MVLSEMKRGTRVTASKGGVERMVRVVDPELAAYFDLMGARGD
jgi:hypothetical protein